MPSPDAPDPGLRPTAFLDRLYRSAVAWSFVSIGLRTGSALLLLPLVLRLLSPDELGIWYALLAVAAASTLVDFGLGPSISRFASYLNAGASELRPSGVASPTGSSGPNARGLADLRATASALYVGVTVLATLAFVLIAHFVIGPDLARLARPGPARLATLLVVASSAVSVFTSRYSSLLMGMGEVAAAMRIGAAGQVLGVALSIALVLAGHGLVGLAAAGLAGSLVTGGLSRWRLSQVMPGLRGEFSRAFFGAMLPNSARLGAVIVGAYLINSANTLVTARTLGAAATASYGLSLQLVSFLAASAFAFPTTKMPVLAVLRQQGDLAAVRRVFVRSMRPAVALYVAGAVAAVLAGPPLLRLIGARTELLPLGQLSVLLAVRLLENHHSAFGSLIVTENEVPFVLPALLSGAAILAGSALGAPRWGMWAIVLVPGLVQLAWNNWWTVVRGLAGIGMSARDYLSGLVLGRT